MKTNKAKNDWAKPVDEIAAEIVSLVADRDVQDRPHFVTVILREMVDKKEVGQDQLPEVFNKLVVAGITLTAEQKESLMEPAGSNSENLIDEIVSEEKLDSLLRQRNVVILGAVIGAGGAAVKTGVNAGSVTGGVISVVGSYFLGNLVESKMPKFDSKALNVATALSAGLVVGAAGTVGGSLIGEKLAEWKESKNEEVQAG